MSDTPTPRTDAIAHAGLCAESYFARMTDFARKLERELSESREIAKKYEDRYFTANEAIKLLQANHAEMLAELQGLDAWRKCAEMLAKAFHNYPNVASHVRCLEALAEFERLKGKL